MKIVFITDFSLSFENGITTYIIETSRELSKYGHEVIVVAPKSGDLVIDPQNEPFKIFFVFSFPAFFYPKMHVSVPSLEFIRLIYNFKPDIIHTHTPFFLGIAGIFLGRIIKCKVLSTFQTRFASKEALRATFLPKFLDFLSLSVIWFYLRAYYNNCDQIIVTSKSHKEELISQNFKKPITVLPKGVSFNSRRATKFSAKKLILYVGRLSGEKNLDVLIESMAYISVREPKAMLWIIGDGPSRGILEQKVRKMGLSQKVSFFGEIKRSVLYSKYLRQGWMFVSPSVFEAQPAMSILEAMRVGLPVVATKTSDMEELMDGNGILTKPHCPLDLAETVLNILRNKSLREKMAKRSKILARKFTLKDTTKKLINFYSNTNAAA